MESDDYKAVLRLVDSRLSLPLVYAGCRDVLSRRMSADNMYICILEKNGLRFPYFVDERLPESHWDIYPIEGLTGYVVTSGKRYWMSVDPPLPPEFAPKGPMARDWIGIPLLGRDGNPLGVIAVQTYKDGESYSEEDVAFLEFVAAAVSLSIQLAGQDREIAIRRIATLMEETIDIDALYPMIHEAVKVIIPAARDNFIIARVDAAAGIFRPEYWRDEKDDYSAMEWPLRLGFSGYIYNVTGSSFIFENGVTPIPPEYIPIGHPPAYWLGAPLRSRDLIIGIVVVQTYDPSTPITKEDEYAINGICPYIADAINHTELFSRLQRG